MSIESGRGAEMGHSWWARGLSLAERLPAGASPDPVRLDAARRRFKRWSEAHDLSATGQFARRLADAGLVEDGMVGLLAEAPEPLAARTARPQWATFVDRVLAEPSSASAGAEPATWQGQFAAALGRLTAAARAEVTRRITPAAAPGRLEPAALADHFSDWLGLRLARLAARTLVLEVNVARVRGTLTGATAKERFAEFATRLATEDGLAALLDEYPVLARVLGQASQHFAVAFAELVERFAEDRDAIVAGLLGGTDPGPLTGIELAKGDPHQRGRMVAILRFDGVAVVYKPRGQSLQQRFGELVGWLNDRMPGLALRSPAVLERDGYGWLEHIAYAPCADVDGVDRFYRRQGALLALLYALDGTDIHCENLIAAGDQPVLVDVETLFHPTLAPAMVAGADPASQALSESVCRTALLPLLLVGEHGALDISGLGGDRGTTFPFAAVGWDDTGTDGMRLVRRSFEFMGHDNQPRLGEAPVDPADYRAALLTGFHDGYDAILTHREELLGLLAAAAGEEIRVVIRPTQLYSTLLDESTHPDVLRDGLDRDPVFDVLWADAVGDPVKERLTRHEHADLWAGDVPVFFGRVDVPDLWSSTGERIPGVLAESGLESVRAKLDRMDEVDRHDQDWLITATFATRTGPIDHHSGQEPPGPVATTAPKPAALLAAACAVADELVARAVHRDERANWLGLEPVDDRHWGVLPLGAGLANGYTGVALFLAQLGELTGTSRYLDLAARALRPVPRLLSVLEQNPAVARSVGPGGFLGTGGICYGLARVATLLGDDEVRGWCARAIDLVADSDDGIAGFAAGRAGGVAALLGAHAETGLAAAADAAVVLAKRLAGTTVRADEDGAFPTTGFAGGLDGVAYGLGRCAGFTAASAEVFGRVVPLADRLADADHGWCSGLAGALLARADGLVPDPDLDRAVSSLADRNPLRDTSLCHGELGVLEALTVLSERGHPGAAGALAPAVARLLGVLDQRGPRCGTPDGVPTPGLLTGLAGIGYGLLRLGFTERVPSVLLLAPGGPV
ncbi:type 2 lanthipeptide synthetase LanM family protein [Actinophytocola oryzae]|uniref:type 2 lanthipeptide synthetase LanM family protein n=1 Tax=Actinophytocola oryzae TaxID=502181 RepID=UPI001414E845|nr:type 2 lanthipeptide synthetase LanM family protein [Actinophytocola oryzae]